MVRSHYKIAITAFAITAAASVFASPPTRHLSQLRPLWAGRETDLSDQPNISYLLDNRVAPRSELFQKGDVLAEFFDDRFLDQRQAWELEQKYRDLNRTYELRKNYGLAQLNDEQCHTNDLHQLGQEVMDRVGMNEGMHATRTTMKLIDSHEPTRLLKKPVLLAGVLAGVYSGMPVDVPLLEGTKLTARTDIPAQAGQFNLNTPFLNSSMSYIAGDGRPNPLASVVKSVDPINRDEKFRMSFSRGLPVWNLSSQIGYGSTTSNLTGVLTKPLTPRLVCELATVHPMDPDKAANAEETIKFNYELHF